MQEIDKRNPIYRKKQLKTTTFSMAIIVATALIFSGFAGAVVIQENTTQLNVKANQTSAIATPFLESAEDQIRMKPSMPRTDWLQYDNGIWGNAFAPTSGTVMYTANRFTPTELAGLDGKAIEEIHFAAFCYPSDPQTDTGWVQVYDAGTTSAPGALITEEPFTVVSTGYYSETWHAIALSSPVIIDETKDIWLCVKWNYVPGTYPAATDNAANFPGKSLWFSLDGATWSDLTLSYSTYNFMLRGKVEVAMTYEHDIGIKSIDSPVTGPAGENIPVEVTVKNVGNNTEIDVPVKVEIFKGATLEHLDIEYVTLTPGQEETIVYSPWTPNDWQVSEDTDIVYDVIAQTIYADDNPANDMDSEVITLSYPFLHDTAMISINNPPLLSEPAQTFPVECTIKNVGQFPSCCYLVNMQIGWDITPGPILLSEDFEGSWLPAGWTSYLYSGYFDTWNTNAYWMATNYAGSGTCAAIDSDNMYGLYGMFGGAGGALHTPPINLAGETSATLKFDLSYNDYSGGYDYFACDISPDGGSSWVNEIYLTSDFGAYGGLPVEIDLSPYCGNSNVIVAFIYEDGLDWMWWAQVDNVVVQGGPTITPEYDEDVAAIILDPGEEADVSFPDWTPDNLSVGKNEVIDYVIQGTSYNIDDTNPANDGMAIDLTLEFYHDVLVQDITSPIGGRNSPGDILWNWDAETASLDDQQLGVEYDGQYIYTTGAGGTTSGQPNQVYRWLIDGTFIDAVPQGTTSSWGWRDIAYDGNHMFSSDSYDVIEWSITGAPGSPVLNIHNTYAGVSPVNPARALAYNPVTGHFYTGSFSSSLYEFDLSGTVYNTWSNPTGGTYGMAWDDLSDDGPWLWMNSQSGGCTIHQLDPADGQPTGLSYAYTQGSAGGLCIIDEGGLGQLVGVTQGSPDEVFSIELCETALSADRYIAPGSHPIGGTVRNDGTYPETGLTCTVTLKNETGATLWDNDTAVDLPTPLGGTQTLSFAPYTFSQGLFELEFSLPLGNDFDPDNNVMDIGIGVDGTAPTSTHTLNPATPDGLGGYYVSDLTVTLNAADGTELYQSGVKEIKYRVNGGAIQTISGASGSFVYSGPDDDNIDVEYWAIDNVDNEGAHHTFDFDMDQTVPDIDLAYEVTGGSALEGWDFVFTATATDDTSGMDRVEFYLNDVLQDTVPGPGPTYQWGFTYYGGLVITIRATGFDVAGLDASDQVVNPESSHSQSMPSVVVKKVVSLGAI
jgi:hypothetical protein